MTRMQVLEAALHWRQHAAQSKWPASESDSYLRWSMIRRPKPPKMELFASRRGLHWGQHATQGWPASLSDSPLQAPSSLVITHVTHLKRKSTYTSSEEDGELKSEQDYEHSASDQGGHDDRQPKRRASTSVIGASIWTTQEWKLLLASGDISDLSVPLVC
jgi:hypothetical protein